LGRTTSVYLDYETERRAKVMAEMEVRSVSGLVADLINERWNDCNPYPPIQAECPVCERQTTWTFLATWPEHEFMRLYQCSACGTTKTISDSDPILSQEADSVTFSEAS